MLEIGIILLVTFCILLAVELAYIPIAKRNHWSTERSVRRDGHPVAVIGGGVVFYVAVVIWTLVMGIFYEGTGPNSNFLVGLTMLAATSFADDMLRLKVWIRLIVQFVAVMFLCFEFNIYVQPFWLVVLFMICCVGFVNAYNFMDGINGITSLYSLVVLGTFLYLDIYVVHFVSGSLIAMLILAVLIFGFFNCRRTAIAFAGDVGSISMGYSVVMILVSYLFTQNNIYGTVLVGVYGVDTFLTVMRRIGEGENILRPHRKHIYEMLFFVWHVPQLSISITYALLQLGISVGYLSLQTPHAQKLYFYITFALLIGLYFFLMVASEKRKRINNRHNRRHSKR